MDRNAEMIHQLEQDTGLHVYPNSVTRQGERLFFLGWAKNSKRLCILGDAGEFEGERVGSITHCPLTPGNARELRRRFHWLVSQPLGLKTSAGCGDRLGVATPGHIHAFRRVGGEIAPILAQQSMRENARTGRSPQQVMDDALWGVFQEGWRDPWGADADHLKTGKDVALCVQAGYTFFTVDPGDHVDDAAHSAPPDLLDQKVRSLPWGELDDTPEALRNRYLGRQFRVEDFSLDFDKEMLSRAAAKYGSAIAHTARLYLQLLSGNQQFELEMSVDETETPTSVAEHFYIARELGRLGVRWVSLAPRYVGRFEKGVDYIGDLDEFDATLAHHAAIARELGPYKLSIHSGSDKFSIYGHFANRTRGLVHLKTAGTSYLEALRAVARVSPQLFRQILAHAIHRYPLDRATYHVSAELAKVRDPANSPDNELDIYLDQFDARQVLHVTFGSVLDRFGEDLMVILHSHEAEHYHTLEDHFVKHLAPFA